MAETEGVKHSIDPDGEFVSDPEWDRRFAKHQFDFVQKRFVADRDLELLKFLVEKFFRYGMALILTLWGGPRLLKTIECVAWATNCQP